MSRKRRIDTVFCMENRVSLLRFGGTSDGHGDPANQGCEVIIAMMVTTRCSCVKHEMIVECATTDSMIRPTAPMRALACETPKRVRDKGFDQSNWRVSR